MIKIFLMDDQPAVRRGLRMRLALEPDFQIVGETGDGATALGMIRELKPDVVLMDVEMSGMDGIAVTRALRTSALDTGIVMLSLHGDAITRANAHQAGAHAFVEKHAGEEILLSTIRRVAAQRHCRPTGTTHA